MTGISSDNYAICVSTHSTCTYDVLTRSPSPHNLLVIFPHEFEVHYFVFLFIPFIVRRFHPDTRSRRPKPGSETEAAYSFGAPFSIRCNCTCDRAQEPITRVMVSCRAEQEKFRAREVQNEGSSICISKGFRNWKDAVEQSINLQFCTGCGVLLSCTKCI